MRIGILPDIHGRDVWKEFVAENPDIHWVFTGDYVDSYDRTNEQIISNLRDIIAFKLVNPDKVELLLGNHDVPYYYLEAITKHGENIPYTNGFDPEIGWLLHAIFNEHKGIFKVAHQVGTTLFTHAGVSNRWFKKYEKVIMEFWKQDMKMSLADVLNGIEKTSKRPILFEVGKARGGTGEGGIVWSCQEETKHGTLNGYNQFVGHTRQDFISTISFNETTSITYCDVFSEEYPEILILDL